ncbi:MAG: DUF637 domain-containing protein [Sideroxyarcus sp.]
MRTRNPANIEQTPDTHSLVRPSPFRRSVAWITLIAYIGQPMAATAEVITVANNRTTVDATANGLPLVQIATPNSAGLSHNQYTQFNVGPGGAILNNSTAAVQTQQAGYVSANPNLNRTTARIILNEVTSSSRSQLNGYTEVAGTKAEVIIANPNGITCNGCGFINTSRGVLTTGTPVIGSGGNLDYFRVTGGDIAIGSTGLNGSNLDQLDLIARSVVINGEIWANNLNIIAGTNKVNYNLQGMTAISNVPNQPGIGIDVALLGGMYANKIYLVGTEAGVGVRSFGTLAAQAGDFTLNSAGLITLTGNTTASGNLTLNADSLNSTGGLGAGIDAGGNAILNGNPINGNLSITTNKQTVATGTNFAAGNLSITAAGIDLANSKTIALNDITLAAGTGNLNINNDIDIINPAANANKYIASGRDLTIAANTITGNGKVLAGRDAVITLQDNYTNAAGNANAADNILFANRNLTFTTGGNFTNQTAFEAQGNLTVTAANIYNQSVNQAAGGSFNSTRTSLTATGNIVNDGRIDGSIITANSNNFTNNASVIGDTVTITANNLTNRGEAAIIGATTNIDLWIANLLSNSKGAEIYSMGNLNIAANNAMDANGNYTSLTQRILNEGSSLTKSSLIEADGNINIGADTIDNQRPTITPDNVKRSEVNKRLIRLSRFGGGGLFGLFGNLASRPTEGGFFAQDMSGLNVDTQSFYFAGNGLTSPAATVYYESISGTSSLAYQYSTGSFPGKVTQIIKASDIASSTLMFGGSYSVRLKTGTVLTFDALDRQGQYYDVTYYPGFDPNVHIHPTAIQSTSSTHGTIYEQWRDVTITTTDQVVDMATVPREAQIRATGNININLGTTGTLNNYVSTIAAGNNLTVNNVTRTTGAVPASSTIKNTGITLNRTVGTTGSSYLYGEFSCGLGGMVTCEHAATLTAPPTSKLTALGTIPSSITAGNGVQMHAGVVTNTTIGGTQTANPTANGTTGAITVPTSGLYTLHPQPGQNYLVVTDPRFTNYQDFISSDYMLSRMSLDPLYTQKRLGDGFYEQMLINDQITQLTGRRFLPPYANAQDEIKALMDAGIAASQDLELVPGLTLTKEQIAALTTDILWMEEEKVALPDGSSTKVLVPKVYLSSLHTADLKPNGALIAADVIDINATGALANSGRIKGNTSVMLAANDIFNKNGSIGSLGDLTLKAGNDIRNESGRISGRDVQLTAGRDILNTTLTQTIRYGDNSFGASNTVVSDTGAITATGNLGMDAGNDIAITGANVEAGGNATLNAGGKLTVGTVVEEAAATVNSSNFNYNTQQITNHTSSIKTGGNLTLVSGDDMHLTSATVEVGKEAVLVTGGDLTIDAAKDSYRKSMIATGKDDFYAAQKSYDETVLGGTINAGGNVTLVATQLNANAVTQESGGDGIPARTDGKGNITLQSAAITGNTGKLTVAADADIDIGVTGEEHSTYSELHTQTSGLTTTTQRTTRDETWRTDTIGSSLTGDSISITSGKNLTLTGSSASAEHDLSVAAMGELNIAAATDTYGSDHYDHEITNGWQVKDAFNITNHGPETTNKARTDGSNQSYNRSSLTSKQGNLNLLAVGNLIASGTDFAADNGELALNAGGAVALLAGQDILNQSSSSKTVTQDNIYTKQRHTITDTYASLDYQGSTLKGKAVKINSGGDTILQATTVTAGRGGITIDAGGDLKLLAAANQQSRTHTETLATDGYLFRADGSLNDTDTRRMNNKHEDQTQTYQVVSLISEGDITTKSQGDTLIEASDIQAEGAVDVSATGYAAAVNEDGTLKYEGRDGTVTFAAIKDSNYINNVNSSNSMPWQSSSGNGQMVETIKLANIKAGKGLNVDAKGGIIVDIPEVAKEAPPPEEAVELEQPIPTFGPDGQPLTEEQKAALLAERKAKAAEKAAKAAKYAAEKPLRDEKRFNDHINQLAGKPGQEWIGQLVKMAKDKPDQIKLQQVNAALEKWDYAHSSLTPEAMAVIAIVVTYFSAGTASGAGTSVATATGSAVAGAAVTAAITTLASQAALAIINNKGNVGKALDDMGKSENVRALALAMVTAGVLQGLDATLGIEKINAQSTFGQQLGKNIINQSTTAVLNHAINGGDLQQMLEQSLKSAFIDTGAAQSANWIGDMKDDKTFNAFTHKLAHAIAGCAVGAAKTGDCSNGALGAVVGELSAEWYGGNRTNNSIDQPGFKTDTVNFAKMMAGIAAAITGGDAEAINLAASTGGNAAENNYLNHNQMTALDKAWKNCAGDSACQNKLITEYRQISVNNDNALKACQDFTCIAGHLAAINEANTALAALYMDSPALGIAVNKWQATAQRQIAPMTVTEKKIITSRKDELTLYMNQFCRGASAESCATQILSNEKTAKIVGELAYLSIMLTPVGAVDDSKTLVTGTGLDGEESNRLLALLGIATLGESSAIAKVIEKAGGLFQLAKASVQGTPEAARLIQDLEAAGKGKYANRLEVSYRKAEDVNIDALARLGPDGRPPYQAGTRVTEYTTKETDQFVRVTPGETAEGAWMMRKEAIQGLTPEEIAIKYSLPSVPKFITDVNVPPGTGIRTGKVASNFNGNQGAVQYELISRLPSSSFTNTRALK